MRQGRFRLGFLGLDEESARGCAVVATRRERIGRRAAISDAQFAAINLANNAMLATRNIKYFFEDTGVDEINPREP